MKNFILSLFKASILLLLLVPFNSMAQPTPGTTGFDNNLGTLAATGISPQSGTVDGYTFTLYSGANAEITNLTSQVNLTTTPAGSGVWQFASIASSDGSDFKLNNFSFRVLSAPFVGKNLSVIGYRDGLAVSGAFTISPTITATNTSYNVDVSAISGFYNVDEFRLQPSGFNAQGTLAIDDITIQLPLVLPVKWVSFDVKQGKGEHQLLWATTEEVNLAYFEIEQSSNAKDFKAVGRISGSTTPTGAVNKWSFNYPTGDGIFFYRIRQVDTDGRFQFSGTRKVGGAAEAAIIVYPNPVMVELRVIGVAPGTKVQVLDAGGKAVGSMLLDSRLKLNLAALPAGHYAIVFELATGRQVKWIYKN